MKQGIFGPFVVGAVLLGCGSHELPPVLENNGPLGDGGAPHPDSGRGDAAQASDARQPPSSFCFDENTTGIPKCDWVGLNDGDTATVNGIAQTDAGGAVPFTLRAKVPAKFTSQSDCATHAFGFTLERAGTNESAQPDEGATFFLIGADGSWQGTGDGGVLGLAAAIDPSTPGVPDSGFSRAPSYTLGTGLCNQLYAGTATSIVVLMTVIHRIDVAGVTYEADFVAQNAKDPGTPRGYYIVIQR